MAAKAPKPAYVPRLPAWVNESGWMMLRGDELESGDVVRFSAAANPRRLHRQLSPTAWRGVVLADVYDFIKEIPTDVLINPRHWYVTRRPRLVTATGVDSADRDTSDQGRAGEGL